MFNRYLPIISEILLVLFIVTTSVFGSDEAFQDESENEYIDFSIMDSDEIRLGIPIDKLKEIVPNLKSILIAESLDGEVSSYYDINKTENNIVLSVFVVKNGFVSAVTKTLISDFLPEDIDKRVLSSVPSIATPCDPIQIIQTDSKSGDDQVYLLLQRWEIQNGKNEVVGLGYVHDENSLTLQPISKPHSV